MVDPSEKEQAALEHAELMAGEFMGEANSTDMATWTVEQWRSFISTIVGAYAQHLAWTDTVEGAKK